MKHILLVGVAICFAACSSHRVRCGGALRPINKPVAAAKSVAAANPIAAAKAAVPGNAATGPGPAAGQPQSLPAEPRP
jgi:hypothetical protein